MENVRNRSFIQEPYSNQFKETRFLCLIPRDICLCFRTDITSVDFLSYNFIYHVIFICFFPGGFVFTAWVLTLQLLHVSFHFDLFFYFQHYRGISWQSAFTGGRSRSVRREPPNKLKIIIVYGDIERSCHIRDRTDYLNINWLVMKQFN